MSSASTDPTAPDASVEVLRGFQSFIALEPEWRALFADAVRPRFSLSYSWLKLCWTLVRRRFPNRLRLVLVREAGELVMAGAFVLGFRRITPTVTFLTSGMPQHEDVLWRPTPRTAAHASLLLDALRRELRVPHRLRFERLATDSPFHAALSKLAARRRSINPPPLHVLRIDDYAGYAGYFASLTPKLRDDHQRRLRRLAEMDGFWTGIETGARRLEALAWLFDTKRHWLEEKGEEAGWLSSGMVDRFFAAMLADPDAPEFWVMSMRLGDIVAAAIVMLERESAVFLKIGHDPAFSKQSPGRTLTLKMIETVFERGLRELDLGQSYPWKERLNPSLRPVAAERVWLS
jgi:CelD/BcsL family acetyltransferase involved in cellulose biosynthesis